MREAISQLVLKVTEAEAIVDSSVIQSLWSGYGQIVRLSLRGGNYPSVVLKHINLPDTGNHPRGWNTTVSHQRKLQSYRVESHWYRYYAANCTQDCPLPSCLAVTILDNETVLVLTDLDSEGYSVRKNVVGLEDIHACLSWLASFHAVFLASDADGLWECGTYWHLDTRPDELAALRDTALREAAPLIDLKLKQSRYQTLVHGDAKLANFCFRPNQVQSTLTTSVAAVDFQYVGRGCGMKDLAYFIGSCLNQEQCEALESQLLDYYFSVLASRVNEANPDVNTGELESEWRALFPFAWADFHRFLKGWSPGHWKINDYSERVTKSVIANLH